jgi:hypothetical protein
MAVFLVTWDLNKQKTNYNQARQNLIDHLSRYPYIKDPGLDWVCFIQSSSTADAFSAYIRTRMDNNDRVVVTKMEDGGHQGWLGQDVWNWINPRV